MANNRYDKVYLDKTKLDSIANGGTIISGLDTYTADETATYLIDDDSVSFNEQSLTAEQKAQARSNIGAGTSDFSGLYADLPDKPTIPTDTGATSVETTGDGNAVSSASYDSSTRKLTLTKGVTALTSHQDISGKEDISNKVTSLSSSSTDIQYPSAKCVFDEISDAIEIAEGKTKNYVIDDTTTGTNVVNTSFNSTNNTVTITITSNKITDVLNNTINLSDLKVGDIVSVIQTSVPDRWVGSIANSEITFYKLETKLDIDSSPTSGSTNPVSSGGVYTALGDYVTKTTAQTISGVKTFSSGPLLNNNLFLQGKNTSSSAINLIGISGTNNVLINNNSSGNTLVGGSIFAPVSAQSQVASLGGTNNLWKNLFLSGFIGSANNASYGLKLPSTSGWTANKTIATTDDIPSAVTSINGLSGGKLTSPLQISGGDAATASKISLDNTASGQITDSATGTLFGFLSNNATTLTVGGNSYALNLRGTGTRPQYKGNDLALYSDVPTNYATVQGYDSEEDAQAASQADPNKICLF